MQLVGNAFGVAWHVFPAFWVANFIPELNLLSLRRTFEILFFKIKAKMLKKSFTLHTFEHEYTKYIVIYGYQQDLYAVKMINLSIYNSII